MSKPARVALVAATIAMSMLITLLTTSPASASEYAYYDSHSSNPCPQWSLQDVLDHPNGDWDHDLVDNVDEIYVAGLNPCVNDSAEYCGLQPQVCYDHLTTDGIYVYYHRPTIRVCTNGYWNFDLVAAFPWSDWDSDGVNNYTEAINGAKPCHAPCPTAYRVDVALNPWGDWDHDGRSNQAELHAGTNPCVRNTHVIVHPAPNPPQRLPHVGGPAPTPAPSVNPCPPGYPYFHPDNGLCYANPV